MSYFILVLLFAFIIFLFSLFVYAREDFILFRKNVDTEKVFNMAFLTLLFAGFFARLFYVILYFKPLYLNPLAFIMLPYFPGLSLPGGILGGGVFLAFFLRKKKYPEGRLVDFFVSSLLIALTSGILGSLVVSYFEVKTISFVLLTQGLVSLILFLFTLRGIKKHIIKEGSVGLTGLLFLSLFFPASFFLQQPLILTDLIKQWLLWIVVFLTALFLLLKQDSVKACGKFIFGK